MLKRLRKLGICRVEYQAWGFCGFSVEDVESLHAKMLRIVKHHSIDGTLKTLAYEGVPIWKTKSNEKRIVMITELMKMQAKTIKAPTLVHSLSTA